MSDDNAEFMDLAQKKSAGGGNVGHATPKAGALRGREPDDTEEDRSSALCQWARGSNDTLIPTTETIADMPGGVWRIIGTTQDSRAIFSKVNITTDSLLRLPDSRSDEVISEIERFWSMREVFAKFGFTHKRGFLLWGPPGSGKTSTVAFVTKQMVEKGGIVILGDCHPQILSLGLSQLRKIEPDRQAVVILEDIDTLIRQYGESDVLSTLDGENSIANVVFIATTNYPENLDGRVVNRPSRFDRVVKIDVPNGEAREVYIKSRIPGLNEEEMKQWVEATTGFSIAHIKELIVGVMCFGNSFETEVKRIKAMFKTPKSDDPKAVGFGKGS